jgi:hypothetical protein
MVLDNAAHIRIVELEAGTLRTLDVVAIAPSSATTCR